MKAKCYVQVAATMDDWSLKNPTIYSFAADGYIIVHTHEFDFDMPSRAELAPEAVRILRAAKMEVLCKADRDAAEIEDQIGKLLCLENKSSAG